MRLARKRRSTSQTDSKSSLALLAEFEELKETLADSPRHIVIMIDDIDRLTSQEIREVMRLVRLAADLPNLVLMLAFDRRRVAEALSGPSVDGDAYLEKMIQVTFDLPAIRDRLLTSELTTELDQAIAQHQVRNFDGEHWGEVLYRIVKPLVRTLRDAKRLANNLRVSLATLGSEVNLADLIALESIRTLRPALMDDIRALSADLTRAPQGGLGSRDYGAAEVGERLEEMIERHTGEVPSVMDVLEVLFPFTNTYLGCMNYGGEWNATFRKERRVACDEVLEIYLSIGLEPSDVPTPFVEATFASLTDAQALSSLLDTPGLNLHATMERLEDFEHEYPPEAVGTAVPVILDRLACLSDRSPGIFELAPRISGTRVILRLLRRIEDPQQLSILIEQIVPHVGTLSGKRTLIEMVGHREGIGHRLVDEDTAARLENVLVEEVITEEPDSLAKDWDPLRLVFRVRAWAPEQAEARAAVWRDSPQLVAALLSGGVGETKSTSGRVVHRSPRLPWTLFEELFGKEEWARAATRPEVIASLPDELKALVQRYAEGWRPGEWDTD
ncbi:MAG: P-loop NTPase fold protein [Dehalococcoidia bacterium]|nr:P-loop NTPase fold protein [Dehalococcoidia bacterium]